MFAMTCTAGSPRCEQRWRTVMVDDLEQRLSRYRADLDAAVTADLARRQPASGEAGFNDADPLLLDTDYPIRLEPTGAAPSDRRRVMLVATLAVAAAVA